MNARPALRHLAATALAAAALATAGCGDKACRGNNCPGSTDMAGVIAVGAFTISPPSAMLEVTCTPGGPMGGQQQFEPQLDGRKVTTPVRWKVENPALGTINANGLFTAKCPLLHGGPMKIFAEGQGTGSAEVVMFYHAPDVFGKDAANNIVTVFDNPLPSVDPKEVPRLVYPLDGAMHPANLALINFQWFAADTSQLFRIHVTGTNIDASFYLASNVCTMNGDPKVGGKVCSFQPDADKWKIVAGSAKGGKVTVQVSASSGLQRPVADAIPINLYFSPQNVRGGLYYFSPTINGLKRQPFGAPTATDFIKGGDNTQHKCVGCHTVSRDGTKVAATFYGGDGIGGMVQGSDGSKFIATPTGGGKSWNFATFSPDGKLLLTNWLGVLTLRDGTTLAKKFDIPQNITGGKAIHPDWSPDGDYVAFVQVPPEGRIGHDFANSNLRAGDWDAGNVGNIAVMKFEQGQFLQAQVIVPSTPRMEYHYFPSWSPDSRWILFVSAAAQNAYSPSAGSNLFGIKGASSPPDFVMAYDQNTARLRLVSKDGGRPIELFAATHIPEKTTSWPRFSPFLQENRIAFFTFSAKFDYGTIVTDGLTPQLWMSAVDLSRAAMDANADPSYPPFWLPFQNPSEKNHSGIWTQETACVNQEDCPGDYICQNMVCVFRQEG